MLFARHLTGHGARVPVPNTGVKPALRFDQASVLSRSAVAVSIPNRPLPNPEPRRRAGEPEFLPWRLKSVPGVHNYPIQAIPVLRPAAVRPHYAALAKNCDRSLAPSRIAAQPSAIAR